MGLRCKFLGGARELGGVYLFIGDKLLIDAGQRPDHMGKFYGFPFSPSAHQVLDIAEMLQLYPGIQEMFRHDYQRKRGIEVRDPPKRKVLITHGHYDHIGGLPYLRYDAEVFMHQDTKRILHTWSSMTGRNNQFLDLRDPFTVVNKRDGDPTYISGFKGMLGREVTTFKDYEEFEVNGMKVTAYPVDHSLVGSCGFIIETEIGPIAISGDYRLRGRRGELTDKFFEAAIERKVQAFFSEMSLPHFEHEGTEDDVAEAIAGLIRNKSFAAVSAPPRDLDRLTSLWMAAKATGRMLCVSPTVMTYLREFEGEYGFPLINDPNIAVMLMKKGKATLDSILAPVKDDGSEEEDEEQEDESNSLPRLTERDYRFHERAYLKWKRWTSTDRVRDEDQRDLFDIVVSDKPRRRRQRVSLTDIRKHPDKFLVMMEPNQMIQILTFLAGPEKKMPKNSIYIRSHPEGWNDEMKVGDARKRSILNEYGIYDGPQPDHFARSIMRDNHQVHVTGHMNRRELKQKLNMLPCPKVIYHELEDTNVEEIVEVGGVLKPERGVEFELERHAA